MSHYRSRLIAGVLFMACLGFAGCSSATNTIGGTFAWAYSILLPVSEFAFLIVLFVLCPMALFKRTRHTAAKWILLSSYLFGLTTWCLGGLLTFASWGLVGLIIGLVFFGLGVVPMGILGAFVVLEQPTMGLALIGMTVLIFATRVGGMFLRTHDFDDQQRQPTENDVIANVHARANAGHKHGQFSLEMRYEIANLRARADAGNRGIQFSLGMRYETGMDVTKDEAEAVRWYRLAAEQGLAGAQYKLGYMYFKGKGVQKNVEQAYVWFSVAAAGLSGEERDDALRERDLASKDFTPEQLSRAQALATTCIDSDFTDCGEPD